MIHALNNHQLLSDTDPFRLFEQMGVDDASHAFYLGYEMMKARTALTLSKTYRQDQALEWGFLTVAEVSRLERLAGKRAGEAPSETAQPEPPKRHQVQDDGSQDSGEERRDTRRDRDNPEPSRKS